MTTKLNNNDHGRVEEALEYSLKQLDTPYLDLCESLCALYRQDKIGRINLNLLTYDRCTVCLLSRCYHVKIILLRSTALPVETIYIGLMHWVRPVLWDDRSKTKFGATYHLTDALLDLPFLTFGVFSFSSLNPWRSARPNDPRL